MLFEWEIEDSFVACCEDGSNLSFSTSSVAVCPDRKKWILMMARSHISFCQTCYAKAPTKDLASQIAYLYLFLWQIMKERA